MSNNQYTSLVVDIIQSATGILAIGVALYTLRRENKNSKKILSVDIHLRLAEQFNSDQLKKDRLKAIKLMKKISLDNLKNPQSPTHWKSTEAKGAILDFFNVVGYFTKIGYLDQNMVWMEYAYWVLHYMSFFKAQIEEETRNSPFWSDAKWLYAEILKMEQQHHQNRLEYNTFITYEMELCG